MINCRFEFSHVRLTFHVSHEENRRKNRTRRKFRIRERMRFNRSGTTWFFRGKIYEKFRGKTRTRASSPFASARHARSWRTDLNQLPLSGVLRRRREAPLHKGGVYSETPKNSLLQRRVSLSPRDNNNPPFKLEPEQPPRTFAFSNFPQNYRKVGIL